MLFCRHEGSGGPFDAEGSFQAPVIVAKGPEGPHLLGAPHLGLVLVSTGPEGPRAFVSCQNLWGIRTRARDLRHALYYCVVGYNGIYAGGQIQS